MRRTAAAAAATRADIVGAALAVFSDRGYQAATLAEVAAAADVTRGAVYHHFSDKQGLYAAIVVEANQLRDQVLRQAVEAGGSWETVCRRIFVSLHQALEHDPQLRAATTLFLRETNAAPELAALREQQRFNGAALEETVIGFMADGVANGALRDDLDPAHLARAFLALSEGLIHLWLARGDDLPLASTSAALAEILFTGIGVAGGRPEGDSDEGDVIP